VNTQSSRGLAALSPLVLAVLAACGGGGGGGGEAETSAAAPAPEASTPQAVADDGTLDKTYGPVIADTAVIAGESTGRVFYVDARSGTDSNDGLSQTAAGSGKGPWQTLAKVNASVLPGDTVRLACGSSWNETLRPARSGTSSARITIASYPAGCTTPAAIDGANYIATSAWTRHAGSIYKTTLALKPTQLLSTAGAMTWAHHPNRGFDASAPNSVYLRNAADSNSVVSGDKTGSTYVTTGSDLVLPSGASIAAGTTIRVRPNAWSMDETTVSSVSGTRLTLSAATSYPVKKGWGFYLAGQMWMLDSPGEWYWDPLTKLLYAWMPDSGSPAANMRATTREVGINLDSLSYVTVDGVYLRNTGTGVSARAAKYVVLRNMRIEDIAGIGIDAYNAVGASITSNVIARTERDGIAGTGSQNLAISGNRVVQAGVQMSGSTVLSLPRRTLAGISAGTGAVITQNTVADTGYNGITFASATQASFNTVTGACTTLDDGAGIYTSGSGNNSTIEGNVVMDVRGAPDGKGSSTVVSEAKGIYLDEHTTGVLVKGNTVVNADHGLKVHISSNNQLVGNTLYGNRRSQVMFHENENSTRASGDVYGNLVQANRIVPTSSDATGFLHETTISNTTLFAQYDANVYYDRLYSRIGTEKTPTSVVEYGIGAWQAATYPDGSARGQDPTATAASSVNYATARIAGATLVPNGKLSSSLDGWAAYNDGTPKGTLTRESCDRGFCARYVAGGSAGLVSTPYFSVVKGQWYRISVDVQGAVDGQILNLVLRRGGGGSNGYEPLSALYAYVPISRGWTRLTYTVQATQSVQANDPVTLDRGARIDFAQIQPGQTLNIANVEMVPVTLSEASSRTEILVNATGSDASLECPTASSAPTLCGQFFRLGDNAAVTWPRVLGPRSSEVIFTLDRSLIDSDRDGIADSQDLCTDTGTGSSVNASGCSLSQ